MKYIKFYDFRKHLTTGQRIEVRDKTFARTLMREVTQPKEGMKAEAARLENLSKVIETFDPSPADMYIIGTWLEDLERPNQDNGPDDNEGIPLVGNGDGPNTNLGGGNVDGETDDDNDDDNDDDDDHSQGGSDRNDSRRSTTAGESRDNPMVIDDVADQPQEAIDLTGDGFLVPDIPAKKEDDASSIVKDKDDSPENELFVGGSASYPSRMRSASRSTTFSDRLNSMAQNLSLRDPGRRSNTADLTQFDSPFSPPGSKRRSPTEESASSDPKRSRRT
jgi:hypothetical protein